MCLNHDLIRPIDYICLMLFKSLFLHRFLLSPFPFPFCHSFAEETSHWSCKVFHILDFADCISSWCLLNYFSVPIFPVSRWLVLGAWAASDLIPWLKGWSCLGRGVKWPGANLVAKLARKERDTLPAFPNSPRGLSPNLCRVGFKDAQLLGVGVVLTSSEPSVRGPWGHLTPPSGQLELTGSWLSQMGAYGFLLSRGFGLASFPSSHKSNISTSKKKKKLHKNAFLSSSQQVYPDDTAEPPRTA